MSIQFSYCVQGEGSKQVTEKVLSKEFNFSVIPRKYNITETK